MLAPERLLLPDEQAVEILQLLDGKATSTPSSTCWPARYTRRAS